MKKTLDEKGRCCGRKPLYYKGGSWRSPPGSPMYFCIGCDREYGPDGHQRPNWAWDEKGTNGLNRIRDGLIHSRE